MVSRHLGDGASPVHRLGLGAGHRVASEAAQGECDLWPMHTYERRWTDDSPMSDIETYRFADALDVVALAEVDQLRT